MGGPPKKIFALNDWDVRTAAKFVNVIMDRAIRLANGLTASLADVPLVREQRRSNEALFALSLGGLVLPCLLPTGRLAEVLRGASRFSRPSDMGGGAAGWGSSGGPSVSLFALLAGRSCWLRGTPWQ